MTTGRMDLQVLGADGADDNAVGKLLKLLGRVRLRLSSKPSGNASLAKHPAYFDTDSNKERLASAERRLSDLMQSKTETEQRLRQCHIEIAAITKLLHQSEIAQVKQAESLDWLVSVSMCVMNRPKWSFLLPPAMQTRMVHRRVYRKGLFDAKAYVARYPDVANSGQDPLRHFIRHGMHENRVNDIRR